MAAIVLPDGESWVVSGEAFRSLVSVMRQFVSPQDAEFLVALEGYEAVKGITLDLLDTSAQQKIVELLIRGASSLIDDLAHHVEPSLKSAELCERLGQLQRLLRHQYRSGPGT